jgi:excisionase family DNA binding protein
LRQGPVSATPPTLRPQDSPRRGQLCRLSCSDLLIARLAEEGLIVQRPGPRGQPSISRESAEAAAQVLAERRERIAAEGQESEALRNRNRPPDNGTVWLSVKTTALLLGLSESGTTLRIRSGTLPATRSGRRWWVRREDAEQAATAKAFERRRGDR